MKLKIFIAALALLFTVNLASAQTQPTIQYGTSVPNTSPSVPFTLDVYNESPEAHVVSAYIETSYPYAPQFSGVVTGVSAYAVSGNGTGNSVIHGTLSVNYSGSGYAIFYITVGFYNAYTDQMWYETYYNGANCY